MGKRTRGMVAAVIAAGCPVMPCRALSWCGAVMDCPVVVRRVPRPLHVLDHQRAPLRNSSTTRAGSFFACILQIHCAWAYDGGSWRKRRTTSAFQPPTGHPRGHVCAGHGRCSHEAGACKLSLDVPHDCGADATPIYTGSRIMLPLSQLQ